MSAIQQVLSGIGGIVPPSNLTLPAITGTLRVNEELTVSDGTWRGTDLVFTYQWQQNTTDIPGATSNTYTIDVADEGNTLRCIVTATNSVGSVPVTSASTATVGEARGSYLISGGAMETFIVPPGVTSVSVLAIGGGGAGEGVRNTSGVGTAYGGGGGGGGGLSYGNGIAVTPGASISVQGGEPGRTGSSGPYQVATSASFAGYNAFIVAGGGANGTTSNGGSGGNGSHGDGGDGGYGFSAHAGGGGGGAGGYSGNGGNGGTDNVNGGDGGDGFGGAAGGGAMSLYSNVGGAGGGGVGFNGEGTSGSGSTAVTGYPAGGGGGSGGGNGLSVSSSLRNGSRGGYYGGGGGGGSYLGSNNTSNNGGDGYAGILRIVWPGDTRQFPNNDV